MASATFFELLLWIGGGLAILVLTAYGAGLGRRPSAPAAPLSEEPQPAPVPEPEPEPEPEPPPAVEAPPPASALPPVPEGEIQFRSLRAGEGRPWLVAAVASHPGRVRAENQDSFLLEPHPDGRLVVAAIADGMGGHSGGAVASEITVQTLRGVLQTTMNLSWRRRYDVMRNMLGRAHKAILARAKKLPGLKGMGSTAVVALMGDARRCLHLYVGDSRLYHLRGGRILYHTRDHSSAQAMLSAGQGPKDDQPVYSQLTASLGGSVVAGRLLVDPQWNKGGDDDGQPALLEIRPDDLVLLCSDGLSSVVDEDVVVRLAREHPDDPDTLVRRCVEAALAAGGEDNVTVLALRLVSRNKDEGFLGR